MAANLIGFAAGVYSGGGMKIHTEELRFSTKGEIDLVDITSEVERVVEESGVRNGQVLVFVPGATGAIITIEHEKRPFWRTSRGL